MKGSRLGGEVVEIDDAALRRWPLPDPADDADKEDRGRVIVVGGSRRIPGAALLAAVAALRAGAGKVTIAAPASIAQAMAFAVPEALVIGLVETKAGAVAARAADALDALVDKTRAMLIGPGLPDGPASCALAAALLKKFAKVPIILDAAAMPVACTAEKDARRFSGNVLLTPHAGEMAKLTGAEKEAIAANPARAARDAARAWNAYVALKGPITFIASPDGCMWRHEGGNPGLATSGSGDVLAGIIAGLAARGVPLEGASAWGVALHARAGVRLAERFGPLGYLARELAAEVPPLMKSVTMSVRAT